MRRLLWGDGELKTVRPVYRGSAISHVRPKGNGGGWVEIRNKAFAREDVQVGRSGVLVKSEVSIDAGRLTVAFVETRRVEAEGMRLEETEIVASGGRRIGGAESFDCAHAPAGVLKGAVGASRESVGEERTGKVVSPNLYIAIAFPAPCSTWRARVPAKNRGRQCGSGGPHFQRNRSEIVGDFRQVVPALTRE